MPFIKSFDIILKERKSIKGMGLIQMLTIITELCDGCWKELDKIKSLDSKSATSVLINIFSNKDFASLMGDFAFATIPQNLPPKKNFHLLKSKTYPINYKAFMAIRRCYN